METLTHTKRRDYLNCPRYFYNRHERGLAPRIQKGGRRRGSAFGDAIFAVADSGIPLEGDDVTLREVIAVSVFSSYQGASPNSSDEAAEQELEQVKIAAVVFGYIRRYGIEHGKREIVFDLPLVNPATGGTSHTFRRGGKIDGLVKVGEGRWRVIEDKFVGQIQKAMIDRLPLDAQSCEYVDALLSLGLEAEIAYRHTLNPQTGPRLFGSGQARRRETLAEYEARLTEDIVERPEHYFDEQVLQFPKDRLDDYRLGRWSTARKIMDARLLAQTLAWQEAPPSGAFPMNPSRCWEYGGCEFIPLCTRGEEALDLYESTPDNVELGEENGGGSEYPTS